MNCSNCLGSVPSGASYCPNYGSRVLDVAPLSDNSFENRFEIQNFGGETFGEPIRLSLFGLFAHCWKKFATWKGRASRSEFWAFFIVSAFLFIGYYRLLGVCVTASDDWEFARGYETLYQATAMFASCLPLFFLTPALSVLIRRLYDANLSGWFFLLTFVPYLGVLAGLFFSIIRGTPGPNDFGPDPRFEPLSDEADAFQ